MVTRRRARMIRHRLAQAVPTLLLVTFVSFIILHIGPGDPALLLAGEFPTEESIAEIRRLYGFDRPIWQQYLTWLGQIARGDLGLSLQSREPVADLILNRLPHTLLIVCYAMVIAFVVGSALGIAAAARRGGLVDRIATGLATIADALPYFWLAMLMVSVFALDWQLFPATGAVRFLEDPAAAIWTATLPAIALSISGIAQITRQLRAAMIEVLASPFVRTLRAKGLSPAAILWRHGMKNVGVTLITVVGLVFSGKIGGTLLTETVFAIPGTGSALIQAAINKDYFVVQGIILMLAALVFLVNLVVDLLYAVLDPRVE
jgi:peptide/nickel transport system permease protein